MNNSYDQISGQIIIKGRVYSAKEIIRGLLEQGIAITENQEGLKIGFKHISPQSISSQTNLEGSEIPGCPFIPYMSQITVRLDDLTSRLNSQRDETDFSATRKSYPSPEKTASSNYSPFSKPSFPQKKEQEKERFFSSSSSFFDNRQKCPSCGAAIPQNAFFCNKCGNHVRSG